MRWKKSWFKALVRTPWPEILTLLGWASWEANWSHMVSNNSTISTKKLKQWAAVVKAEKKHKIKSRSPKDLSRSKTSDSEWCVSMSECASNSYEVNCGFPQRLSLGLTLFNLLTFTCSCLEMSSGDMASTFIAVLMIHRAMHRCVIWTQREKLNVKLKEMAPTLCQQVKNCGVTFDVDLSPRPHIKNQLKTAFYYSKNIAKVRLSFSLKSWTRETLVHAFITCFYHMYSPLL